MGRARNVQEDWFRCAMNRRAWRRRLDQAFARQKVTDEDKKRVDRWTPGTPLPVLAPPGPTHHSLREIVPPPSGVVACPVCALEFPVAQANRLTFHYYDQHAIRDADTTTVSHVRCPDCLRCLPNRSHLRTHTCPARTQRAARLTHGLEGWLPLVYGPPRPPPAGWWVATDGSGEGLAGWGVVVFRYPVDTEVPDYVLHGPVVVGRWDPLWLGAGDATNNTGELSAIGELMLWLLHEAPDRGDVPVHIRFDSKYAANMAQGVWEPKTNEHLAARVRELTSQVEERRVLSWEHVYGHQGTHDNELADRAAAAGAEGRVSTQSRRWAQPQTGPLGGVPEHRGRTEQERRAPPRGEGDPGVVRRRPACRQTPETGQTKKRPAGVSSVPAAAPPAKSLKPSNAPASASPRTPPQVAAALEEMVGRGVLPRTTRAQRRRQQATAGTTYSVPTPFNAAFRWGYIHPNLPPPENYIWRRTSGGFRLCRRGG